MSTRLFRGREQQSEEPGRLMLAALEKSLPLNRGPTRPKLTELPVGKVLDELDGEDLKVAALALQEHLANRKGRPLVDYYRVDLVARTLAAIGRKKLRWTPEEALRAVDLANNGRMAWYYKPIISFVASVLKQAGGCAEPAAVERYLKFLAVALPPADASRAYARLSRFTPQLDAKIDIRIVDDGDGWGRAVRGLLEAVNDPAGIDELLVHLASCSARPSKRWLSRTAELIGTVPGGARLMRSMAAAVLEVDLQTGRHAYVPAALFSGANADVARGALFGLALSDPARASLLGDVACHAGTTSSGSGVARDQKVANGSVVALGLLGTDEAVAALVRVQQKVKNRNIRKQVDRALGEAAVAAGIGVDELIERAVPDHGLGPDGTLEERLGDDVVRLAADGDKVRLLVAKAKGGWTTTIPARIRQSHGDRVAELRAVAKEASKTLAAEKVRVEGLLASGRTWTLADWARLYRDHPMTGMWARRLLWVAGDPPEAVGVRLEANAFVDIDGKVVEVNQRTPIRLWHPIHASPADVKGWRAVLTDLELRQPFKQAWREVYLLTPAEEQTQTYSNRFAAHILRYGQAFALMKARDWAPSALGYWDGGFDGAATKVFPGGTWRATFMYDLVEGDEIVESTPFLCSTDQVRFEEMVRGRWEVPPELAMVPPLIFSEAMRDVDLFVGVASIAADPTWVDRGQQRHLDYWHRVSFGELTESAETRRAALQRLLPRTKIAQRASIDGRFLRVEGKLCTYRIHLGSGNVLMEPNDQYLCIVPAPGAMAQRIFLPFEEDGGRLSLILSKAFLLADDDRITDASIVAQINRR